MSVSSTTLFDKLWNLHVVRDLGDGWSLLHIDRHLLHDMSGPSAMAAVSKRGLAIAHPALASATPDHLVASAADRTAETSGAGPRSLARRSTEAGIRHFGVGEIGQGIVHVIGPELGVVLPGLTVVCGDSHTCTNGALGTLAFGIGTSQSTQVLATQVLAQERPRQMRIRIDGVLPAVVTAKDVALSLVGRLGAAAGAGFAIEYCGSTIASMFMESRMTLCNMTVELGAKFGVIAPDETTIEWIAGRRYAPTGDEWTAAVDHWHGLVTDDDARFDCEIVIDATTLAPMITWGTSPEHVIAAHETMPLLAEAANPAQREAWATAYDYMGLQPGAAIVGTPIDWVFIGSCTNARLPDLRAAAAAIAGRHVAGGVTAWVVPGSEQVRRDAEAEGLDIVFQDAGFAWRAPGCSMCVAANGDRVPQGARCVSTSNRNFVGRQGPGARTHLTSPVAAVAAAIAGSIADPRNPW